MRLSKYWEGSKIWNLYRNYIFVKCTKFIWKYVSRT